MRTAPESKSNPPSPQTARSFPPVFPQATRNNPELPAMTDDPIRAIESLGYTQREAAFLFLVGRHSGYFVRRQFDYFIDRLKGAVATNFLAKAARAGHVEALDYPQGWRVYHLCSRTIYRLLGDSENPLRRRKAAAQIQTRLMTLDYVLKNEADGYLDTERKKVWFFQDCRRIHPELFLDSHRRLLTAVRSVTIALADHTRPDSSCVRVIYVDEGVLVPITRFGQTLEAIAPLMKTVGESEVIFASNSRFKFDLAAAEFHRVFALPTPAPSFPFDNSRLSQLRPNANRKLPWSATFTTILFGVRYPPSPVNEPQGSVQGSIHA